MAATQCIWACRRCQDVLSKFILNFRMGKKSDLSDFEQGRVVNASSRGYRDGLKKKLFGKPQLSE